jgi:hypothetical protein
MKFKRKTVKTEAQRFNGVPEIRKVENSGIKGAFWGCIF